MRYRGWIVLAALAPLLSGCMKPLPPEVFDKDGPSFTPERVFDGRSTSWGVIQNAIGKPVKRIRVESFGKMEQDGSFRLDQAIVEEGKRRLRYWILKPVGQGRYEGTLSDAAGPVTAETNGRLFHLQYKLKQPAVMMEQWLYLQDDNHTILNVGRVSLFGITIAQLAERISHVDMPSDVKTQPAAR